VRGEARAGLSLCCVRRDRVGGWAAIMRGVLERAPGHQVGRQLARLGDRRGEPRLRQHHFRNVAEAAASSRLLLQPIGWAGAAAGRVRINRLSWLGIGAYGSLVAHPVRIIGSSNDIVGR
jgi:hypothetical protein